jgi:hypothetical protein
VQRRQFLAGLASVGFAGSVSLATGLEALRHGVISDAGGEGADLNDWEAIAWEYGRTYATRSRGGRFGSWPRLLAFAELTSFHWLTQRDRPWPAYWRSVPQRADATVKPACHPGARPCAGTAMVSVS